VLDIGSNKHGDFMETAAIIHESRYLIRKLDAYIAHYKEVSSKHSTIKTQSRLTTFIKAVRRMF